MPTPEMRRWRAFTILWCSLICLAVALVVAGGTYYYVTTTTHRLDHQAAKIQHTNENLQRNNAALLTVNSDLASTNKKLQHTLELVTDNGNRAACSIRQALIVARSRTRIGLKVAVTAADKAKAQAAIDGYTALIDSQRTVPLDFPCKSLLKPVKS